MNGVIFKITYNNREYNLMELKEIFGYFFLTLLIKYKSHIIKLIKLIVKLLKIPNYYPYLNFILKLIFIKIVRITIKNMPKLSYVRTNNHFYKKYKNGKKVRITKKTYLKHKPEEIEMDILDICEELPSNYNLDGDILMESPRNTYKSILKRTKKGTRTEEWSDKQVRFTDDRVVTYYLSKQERAMKLKAYKDIKRKNRCYDV